MQVDITDSSLAEMNDDSNDITYCEVSVRGIFVESIDLYSPKHLVLYITLKF